MAIIWETIILFDAFLFHSQIFAIEKKKDMDATKVPVTSPDFRVSIFTDIRIDLVVSKVKITRGTFAGRKKIKLFHILKICVMVVPPNVLRFYLMASP
ncbi:MAG: hypothetical protein SV375_07925 [Thermodesulfobacteriota bacterium]|nr:hypothetical protein [Thermodesulfobacteriota bacterium]